jgi:hypothetical protein
VKGLNPGGSVWGVQYQIGGVVKVEASTGTVYFRIDKLELNQNPDHAEQTIHLNALQVGVCYYFPDGRRWDMFPKAHQGKANSKDLSMTLELNKTYTITDIGVMSVPSDKTIDLHTAWPCSLLWSTITPNAALHYEANFPAHDIALSTIE